MFWFDELTCRKGYKENIDGCALLCCPSFTTVKLKLLPTNSPALLFLIFPRALGESGESRKSSWVKTYPSLSTLKCELFRNIGTSSSIESCTKLYRYTA